MTHPPATSADRQRWRRYLADERVEGAVYRDLAARRTGEEREILLGLAAAEARHEAHWHTLLGETSTGPHPPPPPPCPLPHLHNSRDDLVRCGCLPSRSVPSHARRMPLTRMPHRPWPPTSVFTA